MNTITRNNKLSEMLKTITQDIYPHEICEQLDDAMLELSIYRQKDEDFELTDDNLDSFMILKRLKDLFHNIHVADLKTYLEMVSKEKA